MAVSNTVDQAVLGLYIIQIEGLASNNANEDFFNSGSDHALIVLKTIAKFANDCIKVLSGNLGTSISNDPGFIDNLRRFFINGGKMQVLLCSHDQNNLSKDIFKLFNEFKDQVIVRTTTKLVKTPKGNAVHFTVADSKMFRFETDIVNKIARGNFNDPGNSKILEDTFDKLFEVSPILNIACQ